MTSVLIIDDHRMFAEALQILISVERDLEAAGIAETAEEGLRMVRVQRPDVVVMDIDLPGIDGLTATEQLIRTDPECKIVVVTSLLDADLVGRAAATGAFGFVAKQRAAEELIDAIRSAAKGEDRLRPSLLRMLSRPAQPTGPPVGLTSRELEILQGLADGRSTDELASSLFLSRRTVQGHVQNILSKLQVRSKLEAVLYGLRHSLIRLRSPQDEAM